ncbi:MAG: MBL fold metallo-hydrolase, partial [Pseudooceanicola sp.]|nr:MBL fold metallo-hydrolase [Pseudooceanicola sp.]
MNAYVYGYGPPGAERLILVDLGVTFPDMDGTPGVDLILPDIAWLRENADRLEAVFITHAHEDHVGAVGHYAGLLDVPVHARVFTANIARRKLEDAGLSTDILRIAAPWPAQVQAGPFKVGFLPISHSIPESAG